MSDPICEACGREMVKPAKGRSDKYWATRRFCDMQCRDSLSPRIDQAYSVDANGCWVWQGRMDPNGYGRSGRGWAHRESYKHHVGEIPKGKELDHTCGNPPCINPDHLEPVTRSEHIIRERARAGVYDTALKAANLRVEGLTYPEIADRLGLTGENHARSSVMTAVKRGLIDPALLPKTNYLTPADKAAAIEMRRAGVMIRDIAAVLGRDGGHISRVSRGIAS